MSFLDYAQNSHPEQLKNVHTILLIKNDFLFLLVQIGTIAGLARSSPHLR